MSTYPPENDPAFGTPGTPIFDRTSSDDRLNGTADVDAVGDGDSVSPLAEQPRTEYPGVHVPSYATGSDDSGSTSASSSDSSGSRKDAAKDAAQNVAGDAKASAQHVGGVAKDQASSLASEATDHAKELFGQASETLKDQAGQQSQRAAEGLRTISDQLSDMADGASDDSIATRVVRDLAGRAGTAATYLDGRDAGSLLDEVRSFAARRPGTFIAVAAGAGILAGRLAKALTAEVKHEKEADIASDVQGSTSSSAPSYTAPETDPYVAPDIDGLGGTV